MKYLRITAFAIAMVVMAFGLMACGGGASSTTATRSSSAVPSSVTLGDAAPGDVVSYEVTIASITLGNTTVPLNPRRLELTHLSATVEPLSIGGLTPGTYSSVSIGWSSPEVTFLNSAGVAVEVDSSASNTFTQNVTIEIKPGSVLNLDLDVGQSVTVNPTAGTAAFAASPAFSVTSVANMADAEREAETGEIEDMVGKATVSGNSVTVNGITFTVDANTKLEGVTSVASLNNMIVRIEGTAQADGTTLAKEIEVESAEANGAEVEGLVTSVDKTLSTFTLIVQDGSGLSLSSADLGKQVTVDASNAQFSVGKTKIDTNGLTFATFANISNLQPGQRVEVDSDTPKSAGAGTASDDGKMDAAGVKKVKLEQQAVTGTVFATTANGFTLNVSLPASIVSDAVAAGVTNCSTSTNICSLDVVVNSSTKFKNSATASPNANVRVRGLLFFDSTTGYHLVAGRITTP